MALLLLALAAAPSLIGGGPLWAQLAAVGFCMLLGLAFLLARAPALRTVPLAGVGALGVAVTALQLLPLPHGLVHALSPKALALRTAAMGHSPHFLPLTLDVPATTIEVAKAISYLSLFLITAALARRGHRARMILLSLIVIGGVVAATGLVHRLVDAETIFGLYQAREHPGLGHFAPFVNGNQAAALLLLSSLTALGVAAQNHGVVRGVALASLTLCLIVLPLTGARASFVALLVGATALGARLLARRYGWAKALLLASSLVAMAGAFLLFASQVLRMRLSGNMATLLDNQKTRGWRDTLAMINDYPWTGVGRGAFEAPVASYRQFSEGIRLTHPETLPLQLIAEWGLPVVFIVAALALIVIGRLLPRIAQTETQVQAAAFGVFAVMLQELANFSLELTGVAIPFVVALGVVVGRAQEQSDRTRSQGIRISKAFVGAGFALWVMAFTAALFAYPKTLLAEGDRLRKLVAEGGVAHEALQAASVRHPADAYLAMLSHLEARPRDPKRADEQIKRALRLYPEDGSLHQLWARWLVRLDRKAQAALAYRQAAMQRVATAHVELLAALGPNLIAEAVPQEPEPLLAVAELLVQKALIRQAESVSARAVEAAQQAEPWALKRLVLADKSQDNEFIRLATDDLLLQATSSQSFVAAALALARVGDPDRATATINEGLTRHPRSLELVLAGVQQYSSRGDLAQAQTFLREHERKEFPLEEQIRLQQAKATLAEQQGDLLGAVTARARMRVLAGQSGLADTAH